jgi:hypothetical protein
MLEAGTLADSAEDTPMPPRAAETSVVAAHSPLRHAETSAGTSIEGTPMAVVAPTPVVDITAVAGITAVVDIMAPALDSVSAFTLTDTPLQRAIPPDSMTPTACGNTIRAALFPTDTKLDGRGGLPYGILPGIIPNRVPYRRGSGRRLLPLPEYCR